jgi:GWxTD domain-containing protein
MTLFFLFLVAFSVDFQIDRDSNFVPYVIASYRIPYSELVFYKEDSFYIGEYSASLVVKKDRYQIGGRSKKNKLLVYDYKKTVSNDFYRNDSIKIKAPEGKIEVTLKISDLNSNRAWSNVQKLEISKLKPTDIGSINWLSNPSREVFTDKDTVKIRLNILSAEKGETRLVAYFSGENKKTLFRKDTIMPNKKSQIVEIFIPANRFDEDEYNFFAEVRNVNKEKVVKKSISFRVWKPFFESKRFEERVRQMYYIAGSGEINKMLNAKLEERKKLWNEFWESKDPTPGDSINEFQISYFERVDFANRNFSRGSLFEGWRTDRGKIYIILGAPDYVEAEPYSNANPEYYAYEIWYYYEKGYELIFVQRYLTSEYELLNPPPEFWK